jgi:hypothetical protein
MRNRMQDPKIKIVNGKLFLQRKYTLLCHSTYVSDYLNNYNYVRFKVLTVVDTKRCLLSDIALCSLLKVNTRFRETYSLHIQGRR